MFELLLEYLLLMLTAVSKHKKMKQMLLHSVACRGLVIPGATS